MTKSAAAYILSDEILALEIYCDKAKGIMDFVEGDFFGLREPEPAILGLLYHKYSALSSAVNDYLHHLSKELEKLTELYEQAMEEEITAV